MLEPVLTNPWVRAAALLICLILIGIGIYLLSPVLVPLLFAFIVAYLVDPIVDRLEAMGIPRGRTVFWIAALGMLAIAAIPLIVIPGVVDQADQLTQAAKKLPDAGWLFELIRKLPLERLVEILGWEPPSADTAAQAADGPPPLPASGESDEGALAQPTSEAAGEAGVSRPDEPETTAAPQQTEETSEETAGEAAQDEEALDEVAVEYDALAILAGEFADLVKKPATEFLKGNAVQLLSSGGTAGAGLAQFLASMAKGLFGAVLSIGNFFLFAFVTAYLLIDYDFITDTGKMFIPPRYRTRTLDILAKINSQLRNFMRGQVAVCSCLGAMYAIGLFLSGVPFWLLIGAFGALASFIPYLGLVLTIGPAIGLCVVQYHGFDWHLIGVLVTFTVAQVLEGTVLTPRIVGEQVGLGPVWVILSILVFGNALGFLGLLVAVPAAASLKVIVVEAVNAYKASDFYTGPRPDS